MCQVELGRGAGLCSGPVVYTSDCCQQRLTRGWVTWNKLIGQHVVLFPSGPRACLGPEDTAYGQMLTYCVNQNNVTRSIYLVIPSGLLKQVPTIDNIRSKQC